ncbi:hypothetical protein [Litorisediminicola beolgyonensis]|uniref:Uncharacterized protein n=1 Tax=Litorisediminicola beolgyonensis TaxID=1173614 RepID=A0ABW3ZHT0_9RHOB
MTFIDMGVFPRGPLVSGRAYDRINHFFGLLGQVGGADRIETQDAPTSSTRSPLEERLRFVQDTISEVSMHLPSGFAAGLNKQFANLMDEDAWEDNDELINPEALTAFFMLLICSGTGRRPGIGTNGRGSITASWTAAGNRLTVECLPSGRVSLVLSRQQGDGEVERAAFGHIKPQRVREVLAPFEPEVWLDG